MTDVVIGYRRLTIAPTRRRVNLDRSPGVAAHQEPGSRIAVSRDTVGSCRETGCTPCALRSLEFLEDLHLACTRGLGRIDLHFHDLRHEAGSRLLEAGWPLHHVKDMLGHTNIATTGTYLNVTTAGLAESMRRFGTAPVLQVLAKSPAIERRLSGKSKPRAAPQTTVN